MTSSPRPYKKKLIEVALPLEEINKESAREKSIRHGHPSTLHLWWARRPLAACRAVLWSSLVDDPSDPQYRGANGERYETEEEQTVERERLFAILRELVKWENSNKESVLNAARAEIMRCTDGHPPPVYDPFCGGGSIPLEAQRLGLEAHGSDLNPVAVLITKALIEIPPKWAGQPPVNPTDRESRLTTSNWAGAKGLAADVRYYGHWMREEAEKRIGHLYPKVTLPEANGGGEATVIAWLWARTVTCPNPACRCQMPLVRSFALSTKKGKEAWVEPVVEPGSPPTIRFEVKSGKGTAPEGTMDRKGGRCLACGTLAPLDHIRKEGQAKRMDAKLMAVVAEGARRRVYLPPTADHERTAASAQPTWFPDQELSTHPQYMAAPRYGMTRFGDLFTPRQLVALTTFSDLIGEARTRIEADARAAGLADDGLGLEEGGLGAKAYAEAVSVYLAFQVDKLADLANSLNAWEPLAECPRHLFGRQSIHMVWDFAEGNPLSESSGSWNVLLENAQRAMEAGLFCFDRYRPGIALSFDAALATPSMGLPLVSTDPPYYDNVPYADLSDFFYVWLRRTCGEVFPSECRTLLVPKDAEMVADQFRLGGRESANQVFESRMSLALRNIRTQASYEFPVSIFYAFKQVEEESKRSGVGHSARVSTGWEAFLEALVKEGLEVTGTWPNRSEMGSRMRAMDSNALASSIVLVCRPRPEDAPMATRREFLAELRETLPGAIHTLVASNINPVDLRQACIGPGMAIYSRFSKVVESSGEPLAVRAALGEINRLIEETLTSEDSDYDPDTQWALVWFEGHKFDEASYGVAETLSSAKGVSVQGLDDSGILFSGRGKVRLKRPADYPEEWDPAADARLSIWEALHQLIRLYDQGGSEMAGEKLRRLGPGTGERVKLLAYRLYDLCEAKKWAAEALGYNALIASWGAIRQQAETKTEAAHSVQGDLAFEVPTPKPVAGRGVRRKS